MKPDCIPGWTLLTLLGVSSLVLVATPLLSEAALTDGNAPAGATPVDDDPTADFATALEAASDAVTPATTAASRSAHEAAPRKPSHCGDDDALDRVRELVHYQRHQDADELLEGLLFHDCIDDSSRRDLARFQHAYVSSLLDRPEQTLKRLDEIEGDSPVPDYLLWLRAQAFKSTDRPGDAADAFAQIYDIGDSPLHWYARAYQAKTLVAADQFDDALAVVEQILDTFPDYPRRHRMLYYHGKVLEQLDRLDDAAEAYQKAAFEFPYRSEGERADEQLQKLVTKGHEPTPIDPEKRFEHYRQLSVDKFWPLAHELMTDLRDEIATEGRNSKLENEILQRIALNTYHSHDFEGAAEYFRKARDIYEDGHTDGFNQRTIYRFHNFALARLGRFDEAREAIEKLYENAPRRRFKDELGSFYERYGRYEDAYQVYKDLYTAGQRRGWHFSYLKYKTERFEDAYENFRRLANRSRGKTRSQYMYWAARSLERAGHDDEAAEVFAEILQARPDDYYGIQSVNRLMDLDQRSTIDDTLIARADEVSDAADAVLDVFDQAEQVHPASARHDNPDPRRQPRGSGVAGQSADRLWGDALIASMHDEDCNPDDDCSPGLGLPFPTYGLTWHVGQPLLDPRMAEHVQPATTRTDWNGEDAEQPAGAEPASADADAVRDDIDFADNPTRVRYNTEARIYWNGRHGSEVEFAAYERDEMLGPSPDDWTAYDDDTHHGGLERAVDEAADLFPNLERAKWLWLAGWYTEARKIARDVALEYRGLTNRARPSGSPHELSHRRWEYYIDNRRRSQRADFWGMEPDSDELRFPVPDDSAAEDELLKRQQKIHDQRRELRPLLVEALQEVGDYHMVRQFALADTWWLREEPEGEAKRYWKMAYPRAFPEQVIPLAEKHNVNPYMIWALMLTESSFNPDSISIADALGLLQVLPRTGLKIADLFGADDFGPFDLLEEEHSIEQGVFYFSKLVRKFHGQELLAFAGYNGGPHRVSGWLDMRGQGIPHDEYIEEIPFDESRNYAKKVLRFLNIYLTLYEDQDEHLYVGQNLRTDYLEQPDF